VQLASPAGHQPASKQTNNSRSFSGFVCCGFESAEKFVAYRSVLAVYGMQSAAWVGQAIVPAGGLLGRR
jgi:hypothetical protein